MSLTARVRAWRTARRYWASADTFEALADLTAGYLEGAVGRSPTHCGPPAAETASIRTRLCSLNRTGQVVTYDSQPGQVTEHGRKRAFVEFFATEDTVRRVEDACQTAGLVVFARPPGSRPPRWSELDPSEWDTLDVNEDHDGHVYTDVGGWLPPEHVAAFHRQAGVRQPVVAALLACWQVSVADTEWERNDLLWDTLDDALAVTR